MMRPLLAVVLTAAVIAAPTSGTPAASGAAPPVHTLSVTGEGVGMFPAFDPATERYAATTTSGTGGRLTVTVTTSDPAGRIWIDGRPDADGVATVTGLSGGDEVAVFVEDEGGRAVHSVVYLPAAFPELGTPTRTAATTPGDVLLTLNRFDGKGAPIFETSVNADGVPSYVRSSTDGSLDLKPTSYGGYTVARQPTRTPGRLGAEIIELDSAFREVRSFETVGLRHTDTHDAIVREDGSRILTAYEPDDETGLVDAVIQEVDASGEVVHTWNSADHMDPATATLARPGNPDYAHINSVEVMADGHLLASFRHTSQVLKIAWHTGDGHEVGDIIWRLGGRDSDFTFPDDPEGSGPCAQHTANELPNGDILIFDNGSPPPSQLFPAAALCVDPADPEGEPIGRGFTRITEYALDEQSGEASLVRSYRRESWFALFAGSVRPLAGGHRLIGWASARQAIATEIDADGEVVWELVDAGATPTRPAYFSYRAVKAVVPDSVDPTVTVGTPGQGAAVLEGARIRPAWACRDRGGSSLQSCTTDLPAGGLLDTSAPGTRTMTVTATDGAGNTVSTTRAYTVVPRHLPDAAVRRPGRPWQGADVHGSADGQTVRLPVPRAGATREAVVRLQNDGARSDRLRVRGVRGSSAFAVRYLSAGEDVSTAVRRGTFRTARLGPGETARLVVRVTRRATARPGDERLLRVRSISLRSPTRRDAVAVLARARR